MLQLTRLTGQGFALNPDLIERAEATPDTVVTLVNGNKYVIGETVDELVEAVRQYRADIVSVARHDSTAGTSATATRPARTRPAHLRAEPSGAAATVVQLHDERDETNGGV